MSKLTEDQIFERIFKLQQQIEVRFYEIGVLVSYLRDRGLSVKFIAQRLNRKPRTVYNLLAIHKAVERGMLKKADAIAMGYTNAAILVPHLDGGVADVPLIALAKQASSGDLNQRLRQGDRKDRTACVFRLTRKERAALNAALIMFGAIKHARGLRQREQALMTLLVRAQAAIAQAKVLIAAE